MEVGKYDLSFPDQIILFRQGFLDLHHHFAVLVDGGSRIGDSCSCLDINTVRNAGPDSRLLRWTWGSFTARVKTEGPPSPYTPWSAA